LLLLAAALRLPGADWDGGIAAHPDERFLLGVAERTPLWGDPTRAAVDFPYGHLPVYLAHLLVLAVPGADPLYAVRLLSGLIGVVLVALTGALGRSLGGRRAGWFAAALMTVAPSPIQQAHFYTVDPLGAALATGAVLLALRRRWRGAGACFGLAVACKLSMIWAFVPVVYLLITDNRARLKPRVSRFTFCALLAFALASPWALLRPVAAWRGPLIQAGMVAGRFDVPYTRQYAGTLPFIYPLVQLALWGLGPLLTVGGLLGLGWGARRWRQCTRSRRALWLWGTVFFAVTAGLYVKYPRYLLPIYPAWIAWAAYLVTRLSSRLFRSTFHVLLLASTAALGLAQLSIYAQPPPWITASRWLYANVQPGETIAVEAWDHPLPVPLPAGDPARFEPLTVPVFDAPSPEKTSALATAAQDAEVVVLASRRGYGALARQPDRFATTLAWYERLLQAREAVAFARCPRLGPLALTDDPLADAGLPTSQSLAARCGTRWALRLPRLDESFRVYDAPLTLLLVGK
jgi:4-amino-4-deoxy-L-arabinose transferase-like glycosyltransferase